LKPGLFDNAASDFRPFSHSEGRRTLGFRVGRTQGQYPGLKFARRPGGRSDERRHHLVAGASEEPIFSHDESSSRIAPARVSLFGLRPVVHVG
jgi:hypothetical protein